jgi:hypothetical protein
MWTCCRSTSSEVAAKQQLLLFSFRRFCFCLVEEICNICTLSTGDVLFSSRGRLRGSPLDPRSVRFLTRRTHVLRFLTCNISQYFPQHLASNFFLFEYVGAASTKLCYPHALHRGHSLRTGLRRGKWRRGHEPHWVRTSHACHLSS